MLGKKVLILMIQNILHLQIILLMFGIKQLKELELMFNQNNQNIEFKIITFELFPDPGG